MSLKSLWKQRAVETRDAAQKAREAAQAARDLEVLQRLQAVLGASVTLRLGPTPPVDQGQGDFIVDVYTREDRRARYLLIKLPEGDDAYLESEKVIEPDLTPIDGI